MGKHGTVFQPGSAESGHDWRPSSVPPQVSTGQSLVPRANDSASGWTSQERFAPCPTIVPLLRRVAWTGALGRVAGVALAVAIGLLKSFATPSETRKWKPTAEWYPRDMTITKLVPRAVEQSEVRFHEGDDPRWASPEWDDSTWRIIDRNQVPARTGIFWVRFRVRSHPPEEIPSLLRIGEPGAHDFFWDGKLLHSTGRPADRLEEEIPGRNRVHLSLDPDARRPGEHLIALRMSTHHRTRFGTATAPLRVFTLPPGDFQELDRVQNMICAAAVGAMFTTSIAVFILWLLAARRLILMVIFGLCLSAALLIAVSAAPSVWIYPATWSYWLGLGRLGLVIVVGSLLVAAVSLQLNPSKRRRLLLPLVVGTLVAWGFFPLGGNLPQLLWRLAFGSVAVLALEGIWRKRDGAGFILAGVAIVMGVLERDPKHFEAASFLLGFLPMTISLVAAIAVSLRRERDHAQRVALTAARLEIELLRKSLQPHFIFNTLTALSQVVEEQPVAAVRLIHDLADEFRSLNRLSSEKTVPLRDELALCRAHLRVMSARTDQNWTLEATGADLSAAVPPALFLTLIENGFSHQQVSSRAPVFRLYAEKIKGVIRYRFVSPGTVTTPPRERGGTGLRYVRSRLDESFPSAWTMTQQAVDGGWETVIELHPPA